MTLRLRSIVPKRPKAHGLLCFHRQHHHNYPTLLFKIMLSHADEAVLNTPVVTLGIVEFVLALGPHVDRHFLGIRAH